MPYICFDILLSETYKIVNFQTLLIVLWSLLLCLTQDACCTCSSLSDDSWPPDPLFGDNWVYAGLPILSFSNHIEPVDLFFDEPAQKSPSQGENAPIHLTQTTWPDEVRNLPVLKRIKYEPSTRTNGRKFLRADVAKMAYGESLLLLECEDEGDLEIAQHNFLMCYRYSISHRWTGCFQLAKTFLKRQNRHDAHTYLKRMLESKTCPVAIRQEAKNFFETHFGPHAG